MLEDVLLENRSVLVGEIIYRSKFPAGGIEAVIHQNSAELQMSFVFCAGSHGTENILGSSRARLH